MFMKLSEYLKRQFIQNNQMCVHRNLEGNLQSDTQKHVLSFYPAETEQGGHLTPALLGQNKNGFI